MKTILVLLCLTAGLSAQTKFSLDQIRGPVATDAIRVLALDAMGEVTVLRIGMGVTVSNGIISASGGATAIPSVEIVPLLLNRDPDGNYPVIVGASFYFRNGQAVEEGPDFKIVSGKLVPNKPWAPGDTVAQRVIKVNGIPAAFAGLQEAIRAAL